MVENKGGESARGGGGKAFGDPLIAPKIDRKSNIFRNVCSNCTETITNHNTMDKCIKFILER